MKLLNGRFICQIYKPPFKRNNPQCSGIQCFTVSNKIYTIKPRTRISQISRHQEQHKHYKHSSMVLKYSRGILKTCIYKLHIHIYFPKDCKCGARWASLGKEFHSSGIKANEVSSLVHTSHASAGGAT